MYGLGQKLTLQSRKPLMAEFFKQLFSVLSQNRTIYRNSKNFQTALIVTFSSLLFQCRYHSPKVIFGNINQKLSKRRNHSFSDFAQFYFAFFIFAKYLAQDHSFTVRMYASSSMSVFVFKDVFVWRIYWGSGETDKLKFFVEIEVF